MRKLFFFIAVTALALGFTACSDDDNSSDKQFTETYRLKYGTTMDVDSLLSEQVQTTLLQS